MGGGVKRVFVTTLALHDDVQYSRFAYRMDLLL